MAQRRMFSKTITSSSDFLMMPQTAQNLYFHLGMNADDDGFVEHFMVMNLTRSQPDDLKILGGKRFVEIFDDKVLIILDWKENNFIRSDRYAPSRHIETYKDKMAQISRKTGQKELGIPVVDQRSTQVRLGEVRLGKENIIEFEKFWSLYPKKVEKKKTQAKWEHLDKKTQEVIMLDLPKRIKSEQWQKGFILNPMTYLNGERWNDQIATAAARSGPTGVNYTEARLRREAEEDKQRKDNAAKVNRLNEIKEKSPVGSI